MSVISIESKIGATDLNLATGGTGAAETFDRLTSTGGVLTQDKIDASHLKFRTLAKSIDDLIDGGKDIHLKPSSISMNGTLTNDAMNSAGFVKNNASGVLSGGNPIAAGDLPAATTSAQGAVELATNAETLIGTDTERATTPAGVKYVIDNHASLVPAGAMLDWLTETPPTGWLECNGAAISRSTYSALFAVISTMYGVGDGSTTFNLPDMRGRFARAWDHGAGTDPDAATRTNRGDGTTGDHVGTKQAHAMASHSHTIPSLAGYGSGSTNATSVSGSGQTTGLAGGNETRPININVMKIIKY